MFTWICPQCGREVPPSYSECPACAENRQRAAQGMPPAGAEPVAPQPPPLQYPQGYPPTGNYQPPAPHQPAGPYQPQAPYPPQQQPPPPPQYAPPPPQWQTTAMPPQPSYTLPDTVQRKGLPAWLVTILVAAIAVGVIFGVVKLFSKSGSGSDSTTAGVQQSVAVSDSSNPYAKFLEVTGVRIVEDEKKHPNALFLVVNHSAADLPEIQLEVALTTSTAKAGDDPLAVMTVKTGTIPANGSKDISVPLNTKLRAYELPDWQFLKASFVIKPPR